MSSKILSVRQPWAYLICAGLKDVENRSWRTNYRGELYIHAGTRFDWDALSFLADRMDATFMASQEIVEHFGIVFGCTERASEITKAQDEFGALVGKCDLVDIGRSDSYWAQPEVKFHWDVRNGQACYPIKMSGSVGLFNMLPIVQKLIQWR